MRKTCINKIYELAKQDPKIVFIGSDLSPGLLLEMQRDFPERYFMEGVSEMNIVGMASGMALDGWIPFVNTIASFITRRCYEQVALDVCLHNLPVRLIGNGGGLVYAPLGPTHLAIEDFSLMRALPNMTIVACSDHEEMARFMDASLHWPHPIYIRLGKGGDPVISKATQPFVIGKAIMALENQNPDILVISTGILTAEAIKAGKQALKHGVVCDVMHMHTLKPLDEQAIIEKIKKVKAVITIEEHSIIGGLGSAVADCILANSNHHIPKIIRMGIQDKFIANYGFQLDLLKSHGLLAENILDNMKLYSSMGATS